MTATSRTQVLFALLALMAITRVGHFGSAVSLPDASLACFLLGGLWLRGLGPFAAMAALAFGIDAVLVGTDTVAGWCFTPAYGGLVAGYGVMWLAGRLLARTPELPPLRLAGVGLASVLAFFVVSNVSFWAWSGYFGTMPALDYASSVVQYFPPYLASTTLYLAIGWIAQRTLARRSMQAA